MVKKIFFGLIIISLVGFGGYQFLNNTTSISNISTDELAEKMASKNDDIVFIDVREPYEFDEGHIDGMTNFPLGTINDASADFPKDAEIVIICRSGNRSMEAAEKFLELGFENPINVEGGMVAWDGEIVK